MILGRGDIASVLIDREDLLFFASGVSNSACTDVNEFEKEIKLLLSFKHREYYHLVYFSSLCVYYSDTMYADHKRHMEAVIVNNFKSYTIVRLGNIDWGKNQNTLINYLKAHPDAEIQNTYRHIVSLDEFKYWMNLIKLGGRDIMNIPGRMVFVPDLMKELHDTKTRWLDKGLSPIDIDYLKQSASDSQNNIDP